MSPTFHNVPAAGALIVGTGGWLPGGVTMNVSAFETPPPGEGLLTVTLAVPCVATSLAGIAAVSCVLLTNVVVRGAPFHCTLEPPTNPWPVTFSVNAPLPAAAELGLSEPTAGTGLVPLLHVIFASAQSA